MKNKNHPRFKSKRRFPKNQTNKKKKKSKKNSKYDSSRFTIIINKFNK